VRQDNSKLLFLDNVLRPLLAKYLDEMKARAESCVLEPGLREGADRENKVGQDLTGFALCARALHPLAWPSGDSSHTQACPFPVPLPTPRAPTSSNFDP
jgi:hypothetical protein